MGAEIRPHHGFSPDARRSGHKGQRRLTGGRGASEDSHCQTNDHKRKTPLDWCALRGFPFVAVASRGRTENHAKPFSSVLPYDASRNTVQKHMTVCMHSAGPSYPVTLRREVRETTQTERAPGAARKKTLVKRGL